MREGRSEGWLVTRLSRSRPAGFLLTLVVAAIGFTIPQIVVPQRVDAGHTAGPNGNCWRYNDALMCKTTYDCYASSPPSLDLNCPAQELRVRLVDYFSDARPAWWNAMHEAQRNWNGYYGPWDFQEFDRTDDTYVYLNDAVTGQNGLGSSSFGITWNCSNTNFCTASSLEMRWTFTGRTYSSTRTRWTALVLASTSGRMCSPMRSVTHSGCSITTVRRL